MAAAQPVCQSARIFLPLLYLSLQVSRFTFILLTALLQSHWHSFRAIGTLSEPLALLQSQLYYGILFCAWGVDWVSMAFPQDCLVHLSDKSKVMLKVHGTLSSEVVIRI